MKLGVTGTREGLTEAQSQALVLLLIETEPTEFHHGDCKGVDEESLALAIRWVDPWTVSHPPKDPKHRAFTSNSQVRAPKDYLKRNHDIVDEVDHLVACPGRMNEVLRSGTWATVRYARKVGKPITIIWRDGTTKEEGR